MEEHRKNKKTRQNPAASGM